MKVEIDIPEGFHILALESSVGARATHWRCWMRKDQLGPFRGGEGWTAQEAVDSAMKILRATLDFVPPAVENPTLTHLSGLKLNLAGLRLNMEKKNDE